MERKKEKNEGKKHERRQVQHERLSSLECIYLYAFFILVIVFVIAVYGAEAEVMCACTSSIDVIHENKSKNESANIE